MAKQRKTKTFKKHKKYRKSYFKRERPHALTLYAQPGTGIPDEMRTSLRYISNMQFNNTVQGQVWNINSLYDPDYTHSINHQPLYFDQYSELYKRYQVYACKIKLDIVNQSTGDTVYVVLAPTTDDPSSWDLKSLEEQPYTKRVAVGPSGGMGIKKLSMYITMNRLLGQNKTSAMDVLSGLTGGLGVGSNPSTQLFAYTAVYSVDGSTNQNVYVRTELIFYCRFYSRKINTISKYTGATGPHWVQGATGPIEVYP